jgi:hypothetical protein
MSIFDALGLHPGPRRRRSHFSSLAYHPCHLGNGDGAKLTLRGARISRVSSADVVESMRVRATVRKGGRYIVVSSCIAMY